MVGAAWKAYYPDRRYQDITLPVGSGTSFMRLRVATRSVVAVASIACSEPSKSRTPGTATSTLTAAPAATARVVDSVALRADRRALDLLKRQFTFKRDEVRGGGTYTPLATSKGRATRLHCTVTAAGAGALFTVYGGEDWLFHDRAIVRIGDDVLQTSSVPTSADQNYQKALNNGRVAEIVVFAGGSQDGGVMRAIAAADTETIRVRLEGRQRQHDFTLSDASRRSIRNCVRLVDLIKAVGR